MPPHTSLVAFLRSFHARLIGPSALAGLVGLTICLSSVAPSVSANERLQLIKIGLNTDGAKGAPSAKEAKAASGRSQASSARSGLQMRCWNYGRLVYDAPVGGFAPVGTSGNVFMVPGSQQKQVLDMRSGLCVIE